METQGTTHQQRERFQGKPMPESGYFRNLRDGEACLVLSDTTGEPFGIAYRYCGRLMSTFYDRDKWKSFSLNKVSPRELNER